MFSASNLPKSLLCFSDRINEALNLFHTWWALEGVGSLTYGNDSGNTFRLSMVVSMFEFLHRVINTRNFQKCSDIFAYTFPKLVFPIGSSLVFSTQLAFDLLLFVFFLPALILKRMFNHYGHVTPPRCLGDVVLTLLTLHVVWHQNDVAWCRVSVSWAVSFLSICIYFNFSTNGFWTGDCH